jgi:hypothetical protein
MKAVCIHQFGGPEVLRLEGAAADAERALEHDHVGGKIELEIA